MTTVEDRLRAMGLTVHEVVPPVAAYVPAVVSGRYVYTSGQLPFVDGVLAETGKVGYMTRERCFANDLIMRHVGDRMIISPPLVIRPEEIDELIKRAWKSLDESYAQVKADGLFVAR